MPAPFAFSNSMPPKNSKKRQEAEPKSLWNHIANLVEFSERLFTHATKPPTRTRMISSPNVRKRVCLSIWCAGKDSGLNRTLSWCRGLHSAFRWGNCSPYELFSVYLLVSTLIVYNTHWKGIERLQCHPGKSGGHVFWCLQVCYRMFPICNRLFTTCNRTRDTKKHGRRSSRDDTATSL